MIRSIARTLVVPVFLASTSAFAAIDLQVQYLVTGTTAIGPLSRPGSLEFVLEGNEVTVYDTSGGGRAFLGTRSGRYANFFGPVVFSAQYHGRTLEFSAVYRSHVTSLRVQTDGRSSCRASVSNRLKPGHTLYEITDPTFGEVQLARIDTSGVSCRLSTR